MAVHKQSVSFTDTAFACARELVESGEYPNISAAVSGEMVRAHAARQRERTLFEVEVQRRLALPLDAWEPIRLTDSFTADARAHLTKRAALGGRDAK
jgi:Arc/MetJ-type ribon-helix-helix transcriptional regulator